MLAALWLALPWQLAALGACIIGLHCRYIVNLHGLRKHKNSVTVLCQDCETWLYALKSDRMYRGKLVAHKSYRSNLFIILYLQHFNQRRYIIIPRDSLSTHNYRLLAYHLAY